MAVEGWSREGGGEQLSIFLVVVAVSFFNHTLPFPICFYSLLSFLVVFIIPLCSPLFFFFISFFLFLSVSFFFSKYSFLPLGRLPDEIIFVGRPWRHTPRDSNKGKKTEKQSKRRLIFIIICISNFFLSFFNFFFVCCMSCHWIPSDIGYESSWVDSLIYYVN